MSRSISIVFICPKSNGVGELTRDSKYVDGHDDGLRPVNGFRIFGIMSESLSFSIYHAVWSFEGKCVRVFWLGKEFCRVSKYVLR